MSLSSLNPDDWLCLKRIVRFGETDAAGVMHFHHLLRWCHEAWEESLDNYGLNASNIFPDVTLNTRDLEVALPIIHCEAKYKFPIKRGDRLDIKILPKKIDLNSFEVVTMFDCKGVNVARGILRHLSINAKTRKRCDLPESIEFWLEASSIARGLQPLI